MTQIVDAAAHSTKISSDALDQLFRQARTHSAWLPTRVPVETLREVYELARLGPTSANSTPARFLFLESEAAKERLLPALAPSNVEKTKAAPVTVIVAWTPSFTRSCQVVSTRRHALLFRREPAVDRRIGLAQ